MSAFTNSFQITHYAHFFQSAVAKLYGEDGKFSRLKTNPPDWKDAQDAIEKQIQVAWDGSTQWEGLYPEKHVVEALEWLQAKGITGLSFAAHGWKNCTGAVFDAQYQDRERLFRMGIAPDGVDFFKKRWCPFIHQPKDHKVIPHETADSEYRFYLEEIDAIAMVDEIFNHGDPYPPAGFREFLNDNILKGTPFVIKEQYDIGVTCEGVPLFVSWDPFEIEEDQREQFEALQCDEKYQQSIMQTIEDNCKVVGWPDELAWVKKDLAGNFVTRQDYDIATLGIDENTTQPIQPHSQAHLRSQ